MHFLLKNALYREVHFSQKPYFSFAQFFFVVIEDLNTYLDVLTNFLRLTLTYSQWYNSQYKGFYLCAYVSNTYEELRATNGQLDFNVTVKEQFL